MLRDEVIETLLYGCVTWTPSKTVYGRLREVHDKMLLRCIVWRKRKSEGHILFGETTVRRRRLLFADFVTLMREERLPKRLMFGEMVGRRAIPEDRSGTG